MSLTRTWGRKAGSASIASAAEPTALTSPPAVVRISASSSRPSRSSSTSRTRTPVRSGAPVGREEGLTVEGLRSRSSAMTPRATAGSRTQKEAPRSGPSLDAETEPPCSSTRWRTIARPIPRPPWTRVVELSACWKRSKTEREELGMDPLAGVGHPDLEDRVRARRDRTSTRPLRRGELDRVRDEVPDDLLEPVRIRR